MKNDIIFTICQIHTEVKEKLYFLEQILLHIDNKDITEDVININDFFNKNLLLHFQSEEILISILPSNLDKNAKRVITKILDDHKKIFKKIQQFNNLLDNLNFNDKTKREKFIEISMDVIELLIIHAKYEDDIFFPLTEKKLTTTQLEELKKKVKLVSI
ncbi:MAG: hemerythrin domain-containing protein [Candidatus Firestonebacteria bacterium]